MKRTVTHGNFTISRTFDASVGRVYEAFAEKNAKERWFKGPDKDMPNKHEMDFQVGGHESNEGEFHDGTVHRFEAAYYEILPEERIIYTYEMYLNNVRISVSLAVIEFQAMGDQTQLTLTENGAFLDGFDKPEVRQQGTMQLLDTLAASLK